MGWRRIIDIRELRSFVHIARVGSVTRAAAELNVAQPALSRQIAKLEEEMGLPLFVRHGRGVRLTSAGAQLLDRAEMILNFVSQTAEQVRASAENLGGHLAIGMPPAVGIRIAATIADTFRRHWPAVGLHMREGLSSSLQEWLLDRRIDVAVIYNQPPLEALDIRPLCSEPVVVVGPPLPVGTPCPFGGALRFRDLADLPLIMPGYPHANRRVLEQAAVQHGIPLRIGLEVDSVVITKHLVRQGLGYSVLTYNAVADDVEAGHLRAIPLERPAVRTVISLATLREQRASKLVQIMADTVTQALHEVVTRGAWRGIATWHADTEPD